MQTKNQLLVFAVLVAIAFSVTKSGTINPDKPTPPAPIPNNVRMVLVVAESSGDYTKPQLRALASAQNGEIRQWLNGNTAPNGIRILDPDEDVSDQTKFWQDAFNEAKSKPLPLVEVYNGRRWLKEKTFADSDELKREIGDK